MYYQYVSVMKYTVDTLTRVEYSRKFHHVSTTLLRVSFVAGRCVSASIHQAIIYLYDIGTASQLLPPVRNLGITLSDRIQRSSDRLDEPRHLRKLPLVEQLQRPWGL
jgi:hypothetical protein